MIPIIVDTREQQPWTFLNNPDITTTVAKLDTGDYSIAGLEDLVCIERKGSIEEFAGNITKDRFWREMDRMYLFKHKFLILEFDMIDIDYYPETSNIPKSKWKYIKVKPDFIMSRLAKIQVNYGINVVFTGTSKLAEKAINNILKRICIVENFDG